MYKIACTTLGPIATNCYTVINDETKQAILIDATGSVDSLLKVVREEGAEVRALLLTHGHFDHSDAT